MQQLLFVRRRETEQSLDEIATAIGASADELQALEGGSRELSQLDARSLAAWATQLRISSSIAVRCLRQSLAIRPAYASFGRTDAPELNDEDTQYVARFEAALRDA